MSNPKTDRKTDRKVDPYWSRLNRQISAADRMEDRRKGRKA